MGKNLNGCAPYILGFGGTEFGNACADRCQCFSPLAVWGRDGLAWKRPIKDKIAFTLIELLVVVAIISILAALLTPALRAAKTSAYGIQCVNNLRQLSLATHAYCEDNNGKFPDGWPAGGSDNVWYLPLSQTSFGGPYLKHPGWVGVGERDKRKPPYFCLSNKAATGGNGGWTNYAINGNLTDPGGDPQSRRFGAIRNSALTILYKDSYSAIDQTTWFSDSGSRYSDPWLHAFAVHTAGQNAVFVDGHVEFITTSPHPPMPMSVGSDCMNLKAIMFWPVE